MYEQLAILAAIIFVYSLVAGRIERTPFGGPILYTVVGLALGGAGCGLLEFQVDGATISGLASLTLALVLFTDAASSNLPVLIRNFRIPQRLLLIGLPLTIVLGFGVGALLFDSLTMFEIAILATMLAPTDAALGKAVVNNPQVPENIREGLNVESGLNDGICVPILFVFLHLAQGAVEEGGTRSLALQLFAEELGIGIVVGAALAGLGAVAIRLCGARGWITKSWRQMPVIALAFACYTLAQSLDGSGFIACFTGGLLFGGLTKKDKPELLLAAEGIGDSFALVTWVVFGAVLVPIALRNLSWPILLYSCLSLTVVRMLPVFLSLAGVGLVADSKLFIGWFGPRGLASVVFAVIVVGAALPGAATMATIVTCTVSLSILAHGLSAIPLARAFGARQKPEAAASSS